MHYFLTMVCCVALHLCIVSSCFAEESAERIVEQAFDYWRGTSSYAEFSMTIHRSDFERSMQMKGWTKGRSDALFFVMSPPKDAGNGSLKKGRDMWSYNPKINRAIKLPPSMMSQSWMGSDFSNDDLAKSDSILDDYVHTVIDRSTSDGHTVYTIESIAKEEAPVVWGKQVMQIRDDAIMLNQKFYDEDMELVKEMSAADLVEFSGRLFPSVWTMRRVDEKDRYTRLDYHRIDFDGAVEDRMFTLANLKSRKKR